MAHVAEQMQLHVQEVPLGYVAQDLDIVEIPQLIVAAV
jgi:hypothetical protein